MNCLTKSWLLALSLLVSSAHSKPAQAPLDFASPVKPNAMVLLDSSGSMQNDRLEIAKEAITHIISSTFGVRFCLAKFHEEGNLSEGAEIFTHDGVVCDDGSEHKENLINDIDNFSLGAHTPLAEAYYDITRVFRGEGAHFGIPKVAPGSPIQHRCQSNAVIIIGDGQATHDWDSKGTWKLPTIETDGGSLPNWDGLPNEDDPDGKYPDDSALHPITGESLAGKNAYVGVIPYPSNSDGWLGGDNMALDSFGKPTHVEWISGTNYNKFAKTVPHLLDPPYRTYPPCNGANNPHPAPPCDQGVFTAPFLLDYSSTPDIIEPTLAGGARIYIDDLALYGQDVDLRQGGTDASGISFDEDTYPKQNLSTYAIGVDMDQSPGGIQAFEDAARNGGGFYRNIVSTDENALQELKDALVDSLSGLLSTQGTSGRSASVSPIIYTNEGEELKASYFATEFNAEGWSGNLSRVDFSPEKEDIGERFVRDWNADEKMPPPAARKIFTQDGGKARVFRWTPAPGEDERGAISAQQKDEFTRAEPEREESLLNYLRGSAENEGFDKPFRSRTRPNIDSNDRAPLGDIVNSPPIYVHDQAYNYDGSHEDGGGTTYEEYLETKADNDPLIFVGANDGMLHAIDAEDGEEAYAFIPNTVFENLPRLAQKSYPHQYYVDGSLISTDAQLDNKWTTVLGGTTGAGGKSLFLLDIGKPTPANPDDLNAYDNIFRWEVNASSMNVVEGETVPVYNDLGYVLGDVRIAQVNPDSGNPRWVMITGNGVHSTDGKAVVYVIDLEKPDDPTILTLNDTVETNTSLADGVVAVNPVDIDQDGDVDRIYAGTLHGELWRIDYDSEKDEFALSSDPLFTTQEVALKLEGESEARSIHQPITGGITVGRGPVADSVMVFFGTGAYFDEEHRLAGWADIQQSLYALVDKPPLVSLLPDDLKQLQIKDSDGYRYVSPGTESGTGDANNGWKVDLIANGEKSIVSPVLFRDHVYFATHAPHPNQYFTDANETDTNNDSSPLLDSCVSGSRGWILRFNQFTGDGSYALLNNVPGDKADSTLAGEVFSNSAPNTPLMLYSPDGTHFLWDLGNDNQVERSQANSYQRATWRIIQ